MQFIQLPISVSGAVLRFVNTVLLYFETCQFLLIFVNMPCLKSKFCLIQSLKLNFLSQIHQISFQLVQELSHKNITVFYKCISIGGIRVGLELKLPL